MLTILNEYTDPAVVKVVMHCALAVLQPKTLFWQRIPKSVDTLDFHGNHLGKKDDSMLADILANLPSTVEKIDISGNDIDIKSMPKLLAAMPSTVTHVAYESDEYVDRATMSATFWDYSFLFNCLASVALVAGGAMLIVGIVALSALLAVTGLCIVTAVVGGAALSNYGIFSSKPPKDVDTLEDDLWMQPVVVVP